ncbi:GEVED domain-containing protein, partial [Salinimicrobium flavum]
MKSHYSISHDSLKKGFVALLFLLICIPLQAQVVDLNESGVLPEITAPEMAGKPIFKNAKRARPFNMNQIIKNRGLGKGANLQLHLFDNKKFESVVERRSTDINGVTTIVVKLKDYQFARGYISISQSSFLIDIHIPELNEKYTTRGDKSTGTNYLLELEEDAYSDLDCGTASTPTKDESSRTQINSTEKSGVTTQAIDVDPATCEVILPGAADPAVIDLLVVYTPAAEQWAIDNGTDINTLIATNIAESNEVVGSNNNNLGISFFLVHSEKLNYTEQGGIGTDWGNLLTYGDGNLDEVHSIRKTYNADLVVMLSSYENSGNGGIATPLNSRYGMPTNAFAAVRVDYAAYTDAFIHEIGHMMGAGHHKEQTDGPGPTTFTDWPTNTWSAGWRWQGTDNLYYSDIMTYQGPDQFPDGNSTSHIPYFSDSKITIDGQSIGDSQNGDNARTLLEMKHYVARYEESAQYCLVNPPDNYVGEYFLSSVNMGLISITSSGSGYSDYTTLATCLLPGEVQQLSVEITKIQNWGTYFSVWIDWNDNKEFDSDELEFTSDASANFFTTNITAPVGFPAGPKRMRIRTHPNSNIDPCGGSDLGEIEDYTINLGEATPCTTASTPQNFDLTETQSNNASFSWDSVEGATSYELRYRKTGATQWNLISDIRFPYYTLTGLELLTEYEAQVRSTCQGIPSEFTSSLVFSTTDYCSSSGTDGNLSITRVRVGTIDNISSGDASGYTDFTSMSTDLKQGDQYSLTIDNSGPSGSDYPKGYRAWIDYNNDADFEDPGELVFDVVSSTNTANGTFTVPLNYTAEVRMRISFQMFRRPAACGDFEFGEVEDYTVNIINPGNQAPVANAGVDQTLTDTDNNGTELVTLDGSGST